jgi:nucleoside permease NupC
MGKYIGILGIFAILGIALLLSTDRRAISLRVVAWGLGLQAALAVFILKMPLGHQIFQAILPKWEAASSLAVSSPEWTLLASSSLSRFCLPSFLSAA